MDDSLAHVNMLTRRKIEAQIAGPLIRAFIEKYGADEALPVVRQAVKHLALQGGALRAAQAGGNSLADFAKSQSLMAKGDALRVEVLTLSETKYHYHIVRCRYAELYTELGMGELGYLLSCGRDFDMIRGFNPRMKLTRTKTIMQGDDHCDFRITLQ